MKNSSIPRIYIQEYLQIYQTYNLSKDNSHYLVNVLRMKIQEVIEIFNDSNYVFFAKIIFLSAKIVTIKIFETTFKNNESVIDIHIGQVISKNDKIDFIIQKSTEMGVKIITPLFSENCDIKKKVFNFSHKMQRWKKIMISSCQQCHRNAFPQIQAPEHILSWCKNYKKNDMKIIFHPHTDLTINQLTEYKKHIRIIVGPEGGFSKHEMKKIIEYGFVPVKLGPRILRTETAAVVAISVLQTKFGDFKI